MNTDSGVPDGGNFVPAGMSCIVRSWIAVALHEAGLSGGPELPATLKPRSISRRTSAEFDVTETTMPTRRAPSWLPVTTGWFSLIPSSEPWSIVIV